MLVTIGKVALKALVSMGMKLVTEEVMEDLFLWMAEKLAARTENKIDDQLVAKVKEHLEK